MLDTELMAKVNAPVVKKHTKTFIEIKPLNTHKS